MSVCNWPNLVRTALFALVPLVAAMVTRNAFASETAISVRFVDSLPVIEVQLDDVHLELLLDTGGPTAITLPPPVAVPSLGVTKMGDTAKMGDAGGRVIDVPRIEVASLKMGGWEAGPLEGLINYHWGLQAAAGAEPDVADKAIVGLNAFAKGNPLMNLGARTIRIYEHGLLPPTLSNWSSAPLVIDKRGPIVTLEVGQKKVEMALDSAATSSLVKKASQVFDGGPSPCRGRAADAAMCGSVKWPRPRLGTGRVAQTIELAVVAMGDVPFDGMLGIDFFMKNELFFDLEHGRLYYRPAKP